jgi:hypothetical protein
VVIELAFALFNRLIEVLCLTVGLA